MGEPGGDGVVTMEDATFLDKTFGQYSVVDFWGALVRPVPRVRSGLPGRRSPGCPGRAVRNLQYDESPATAALLQISTIPTVVVFGPDGSELQRASGVMNRRRLEQLLNDARTHSAQIAAR